MPRRIVMTPCDQDAARSDDTVTIEDAAADVMHRADDE
jgi:hypothetical protein